MNKSVNISEINNQLDKVDLFLCSASFENRCYSVSEVIDKSKVSHSAIIYNLNEKDSFTKNLQHLETIWKDKNEKIIVSFKDPNSIVETLGYYFNEFFSEERKGILLDSTTFTHEGLLVIMRFLYNYKDKFTFLKVVYVCAEEYSFNTLNVDDKWLTRGIKYTKTILGYPGISNPSKLNHLVVLFGFEIERTIKLINQMDFDKITLCFGSKADSINDGHYEINKKRYKELLQFYPNAQELEISLTNPIKTKKILLDHLNFKDYNIVIAPMNNKISTIGVSLAAFEKPEIQLVYSKANEYNVESYSKTSDKIYIFDLF